MVIELARSQDVPDVKRLLQRLHLPIDGIDRHAQTLLVARDHGRVVGSAALELYADGALLRSVAVDPALQGQRRFFPRFGFERITRDDVPASVQDSVEFRVACPASAAVMRRRASI
jgi:amino-acid N-acetyltransferase